MATLSQFLREESDQFIGIFARMVRIKIVKKNVTSEKIS